MKVETLAAICILLAPCSVVAGFALTVTVGNMDSPTTLRIPAEDAYEHRFEVSHNFMRVGFSVQVDSGPRVDVYILVEPDYVRYQNDLRPAESNSHAFEDVYGLDSSVTLPEGIYWLVVDNSDYGTPNAHDEDVEIWVSLSATQRSPSRFALMWFGLIGGALFFFMGIFLFAVEARRWQLS